MYSVHKVYIYILVQIILHIVIIIYYHNNILLMQVSCNKSLTKVFLLYTRQIKSCQRFQPYKIIFTSINIKNIILDPHV